MKETMSQNNFAWTLSSEELKVVTIAVIYTIGLVTICLETDNFDDETSSIEELHELEILLKKLNQLVEEASTTYITEEDSARIINCLVTTAQYSKDIPMEDKEILLVCYEKLNNALTQRTSFSRRQGEPNNN